MSQVGPRVNSHLDFQGLGELRGRAQRQDGGALREVAQQFEAMFIQQIMKTMREAGFKGGELLESQAMDTFQSMHDKEISLQMARRGGFGLADMLVRSMERQAQAIPAADALAGRMKLEGGAAGTSAQAAGLPLARPTTIRPLNSAVSALPLPRKPEAGLPLQREMHLPGMRAAPQRVPRSAE